MPALFTSTAPGPSFLAYKVLCALVATALQSSLYFWIGQRPLPRSVDLLRTRLDDVIPFWPRTAWLYLPVYFLIFVVAVVGFRTRRHFDRALVAFACNVVIGAAGHLLIAAEYPRPVLRPPFSGPSELFLAWVQSVDPPGNVFPSLHVAHSSALALILHHENRRLGRVVICLALVLALSTLTTKQHFIADVISGFFMAGLARWLLLRDVPSEHPPFPVGRS